MKFYVSYFGCGTNQAEIQELIIELENTGYELTSNALDADFGIVNTCSVTEKAEKDVFRFVNKIYKKTNAKWIITGCTVSKEKENLKNRYKNYYFLDNIEKKDIFKFISNTYPIKGNVIYHTSYRSRFFLKIQDGCNFRCSFCIVPFLRGKSISIPSSEIIEKAKYFSSIGYREIVLTGINLSSYGYDLFPRENLLNVIKGLNKINNIAFIRLSSLDPRYIKYSFIKELSYVQKIANSFHLSFQSGSNSVLKRMKRGIKTIEYLKMLDNFRKFFPEANYGTDIIVGFPEETEKEYQETLSFVRQSNLNYIHIFPFSPRIGTKAALIEPVAINIVKRRVKEIQGMNKDLKLNYKEKFKNKIVEGILTKEGEERSFVVSSNFLTVSVPPTKGYRKKKVKIKILRVFNENICEGIIVENRKSMICDL